MTTQVKQSPAAAMFEALITKHEHNGYSVHYDSDRGGWEWQYSVASRGWGLRWTITQAAISAVCASFGNLYGYEMEEMHTIAEPYRCDSTGAGEDGIYTVDCPVCSCQTRLGAVDEIGCKHYAGHEDDIAYFVRTDGEWRRANDRTEERDVR